MRPIHELTTEIDAARAVLGPAERIVVLTGAGISTDSGKSVLGPWMARYAYCLTLRSTFR